MSNRKQLQKLSGVIEVALQAVELSRVDLNNLVNLLQDTVTISERNKSEPKKVLGAWCKRVGYEPKFKSPVISDEKYAGAIAAALERKHSFTEVVVLMLSFMDKSGKVGPEGVTTREMKKFLGAHGIVFDNRLTPYLFALEQAKVIEVDREGPKKRFMPGPKFDERVGKAMITFRQDLGIKGFGGRG